MHNALHELSGVSVSDLYYQGYGAYDVQRFPSYLINQLMLLPLYFFAGDGRCFVSCVLREPIASRDGSFTVTDFTR